MEPFVQIVICLALLTRLMVSRFPYSGHNTPPKFGDYEAQRHWQEIAINLPASEWYQNSTLNDLQYWGLDYPPLSAYHSYLNGKIAEYINPDWVKLNSSRGYESYEHKLFMRSTVVIADLAIFFTSLYAYWMSFTNARARFRAIYIACSLFYPGLILIDHGHFQYNCISIGLTIWAIVFLQQNRDLLGTFLFCLALNYKHLALYQAIPFFCYLAGKTLKSKSKVFAIRKLTCLAVVVSLTFAILWSPWLSSFDQAKQVVIRLFPLNRGLFEDKVANIWCSADVLLKLRIRFSNEPLALVSLIMTLLFLLPSALHLLINPTLAIFKYALINSSLIFFLFSFQVHEKQILIAASAVTLVMNKHPLASVWFFFVSTFSLLPLLIKDGQTIPYFVLQTFLFFIYFGIQGDLGLVQSESFWQKLTTVLFIVSMVGCSVLSIAQIAFLPPKRYPDIHSLLNASFSCVNFGCFLFYFYWQQINENRSEIVSNLKLKEQ